MFVKCRRCKRPIRPVHHSRKVGSYRYHDACRPRNKKRAAEPASTVEQTTADDQR